MTDKPPVNRLDRAQLPGCQLDRELEAMGYRPNKFHQIRSAIRLADDDGRIRDAYYLRSQLDRLGKRLIEMVRRA